MVNKPLIRPAISWGGGSFGGVPARIPLILRLKFPEGGAFEGVGIFRFP